MAPLHAPPTKILSSTPLPPGQAHAFLTAFTTAAEVSKNDVHNGHNEIVFTNLKRIEQALVGIHVPRPVQGELDIEGLTDMTAPIVEQVVPIEGEGEDQEGEDRENGEDDIDALREGEDEDRGGSVPAVKTGVKKADKKADKKARRKEEKRQRAEQRKKEKDEEDDGSE